jgi:serine phosphatase RsbU (regulator of sigma subunit)
MEIWGGHAAFEGELDVPGNQAFVSCRPWTGATHGGDVYYISNCSAGLITRFVLADVSGHGPEVAQSAQWLRGLMRRNINIADQRTLARNLSKGFGDIADAGRFATAILLTYFAPTDHLVVCNAGHPRPLHFDAARGLWQLLDESAPGAVPTDERLDVGVADLPLGIIDPTSYRQFAVKLSPGDIVVLYTDAFLEAMQVDGTRLGERGLLALAAGLDATTPKALADGLCRAAAGMGFEDDATVVVLQHDGSDPPRQTLGERVTTLARLLGLRAV